MEHCRMSKCQPEEKDGEGTKQNQLAEAEAYCKGPQQWLKGLYCGLLWSLALCGTAWAAVKYTIGNLLPMTT